MSSLITRQIVVQRGEREMVYPFTTFSSVFTESDGDTPAAKLMRYLAHAFTCELPDLSNAASISQMSELVLTTRHEKDADLSSMAMAANFIGKGQQQHPIVQEYFIKNDPYTIAYEVPVWSEDGAVSGHIDLLRILAPDRIQLPDFKPNAHRERKAASQVFRYRDLLAKAAGIPTSCIEACYFDERNTYFLN